MADGALHLNNPINEIISETSRIDEDRKTGCLVSIGTAVTDIESLGKKNVKLFGIAKACADISINCTNVAQDFGMSPDGKQLYNSHRYFHFNVIRQLDEVELEDWTELDGNILEYVDKYLKSNERAIETGLCADSLSQ